MPETAKKKSGQARAMDRAQGIHPVSEEWIYRTHPAFQEDRRRSFMANLAKPHRWSSIYEQLAVFMIILALWPLPLVIPIKLLVVLFHETSHILAACLTGGSVYGLAIDPEGAGVTLGAGGNEVLIVAAGYAGSLLFGILLYVLCASVRPRAVWAVLSIVCCLSPWFRYLNEFTGLFNVIAIGVMVLGFFLLTEEGIRFFVRLIATTCCLYPVIDIARESSHGGIAHVSGIEIMSDVTRLSMLTGISEGTIATFCMIVGLLAVAILILWTSDRDGQRQARLTLIERWRKKNEREYWRYDPSNPSTTNHYTIR